MTEDGGKPQRPNVNYRLSKQEPNPLEEEKLNFYYNRQHRLDKASENVKKLYKEPSQKGFNLLRPLVADKPRATIFVSIVILCLMIFMFSFMNLFRNNHVLEGNKLEISGTRYEGATIIVIKKIIKSQTPYTGAVDIGVSPVQGPENEDYPIFLHRIFFTLEQEEVRRFVVPYDSPELALVLQTEKSALTLKLKPE